MAASWSKDTRFKKTEIVQFPSIKTVQTIDSNYWKHLQQPVSIQEFGSVSKIDVCQREPHYIAVTGSTRVQIFNPLTNGIHKTLTKFCGAAYGGRFRRDGQLICVGGEDGAVKVFDVNSKTLLRLLQQKRDNSANRLGKTKGNEIATRCCDFMLNNKTVAGFSDSKTVTVWDIATEEVVSSWDLHTDYVRAGCTSDTNSNLLVSGSYDHSVRMWDCRVGMESTLTFDHGSPVESVMYLPKGTLLASAGTNEVKIWDIIAGKLLTRIVPHNKTITSLGLAKDNTRLVTSSLDRQVKLHDIATFKTVHSIGFPSPVLTAAISSNDGVVCAGMSDGLIQFLHRKVPPTEAEKEEAALQMKKTTMRHRYLQFTTFEPQEGDLIIKQEKEIKGSRHDHFLRKFEYSKALDQVLKPYVQRKLPENTYSVLRELKRRNALRTAIGGRDEKSLKLILQFLVKNINEPRFSRFLMEVVDVVLEMYGSQIGNSPETDRLFLDLKSKVDRELRNMRQLMSLQGAIDLIIATSESDRKPVLRSEDVAFRNMCVKTGNLMKSQPSDAVLSWEKTLVQNVF